MIPMPTAIFAVASAMVNKLNTCQGDYPCWKKKATDLMLHVVSMSSTLIKKTSAFRRVMVPKRPIRLS